MREILYLSADLTHGIPPFPYFRFFSGPSVDLGFLIAAELINRGASVWLSTSHQWDIVRSCKPTVKIFKITIHCYTFL